MRETRWNYKVKFDEEEKRKMYHDLCNPMDTYEEMAKRIGTFSSIDHLLKNTLNLQYINNDGITLVQV